MNERDTTTNAATNAAADVAAHTVADVAAHITAHTVAHVAAHVAAHTTANAAVSAATRNVVLIGMPGAGKSSVGVVLAKMLKCDFLDGDLVIQNKHEKTLQELINKHGPSGFLAIENNILKEINVQQTVIATGGSAVYSTGAMQHLRAIGTVVYLEISYEELAERLGNLQERGVVLKDGIGMSLADLYAERLPLYEQWANVTVDVRGLNITQAAHKIAQALSFDETP